MAETHEWWETTLLCCGFVAFTVLSLWLYYRTSESYHLRKHMGQAGYQVPGWGEYFKYCCSCCWGPFARREWEKHHRFYRHAYPSNNANQQWLGKYERRGKWTQLPRGDEKLRRKKVRDVLSKAKARLTDELFASAIAEALEAYVADARTNEAKSKHHERMQQEAQRRRLEREKLDQAEENKRKDAEFQRLMAEEAMQNSSESSSEDSEDEEWGMGATGSWGAGGNDIAAQEDTEWDAAGEWGAPTAPGAQGAWGETARRREEATRRQSEAPDRPEEDDAFDTDMESMVLPVTRRQTETSKVGSEAGRSAPSGRQDAYIEAQPTADGRRGTKLSLVRLRQKTREMTGDSIQGEHSELPNKRCPLSNLPSGAETFTRSMDFIPWSRNAVGVPPTANTPASSYLNASYMKGHAGEGDRRYIVTQAPFVAGSTPSGKSDTVAAFWSMLWGQAARVVVAIQHGGVYWPEDSGKVMETGALRIALAKKQDKAGFVIRKFELSSLDGGARARPRSLYHFAIESWPTEGPHISTLTTMIEEVIHSKSKPTEPIVVHDLEGGSAAGVYVGIMNGMAMIKKEGSVDLGKIVEVLREDRAGMVRSPVEYAFMHKVLTMHSIQHVPAPPSYVDTPIFESKPGSPPTGRIAIPVDPRKSTGVQVDVHNV